MSRECHFCKKRRHSGNRVSHSNTKTKRGFLPNLQYVRHQTPNGTIATLRVCTRCLRSGLVVKPLAKPAYESAV